VSLLRLTWLALTRISIMGGTFMSMPEDYRHKFVAGLHNALNGHTGEDIDEVCRYHYRDEARLLLEATFEVRPSPT